MADKVYHEILNQEPSPQLYEDLGAIGPAGETVWAKVVSVKQLDGEEQVVTIADGDDATQGAIADAAVAAGAAGTVSAKLRRLTTDLSALLTELQGKADTGENQSVIAASNSGVDIGDVTINNEATDQVYTAERPLRNPCVLHRTGITAADKLAAFEDADITMANTAEVTGSLTFDTEYFATAVPGNRWGPATATVAVPDSVTTANDAANTHVVALTIAQRANAEWYEIFTSTDAVPLHVGRITEAQRAAGCEILTEGVVTAGGAAGVVYVGVVGTGVAASAAPFAVNNAFWPNDAGIAPINCTGYSKAYINVRLSVTDLRSVPSVSLVAFLNNELTDTEWHKMAGYVGVDGNALDMDLSAIGDVLEQFGIVDVSGSDGLVVLVNDIGGHDASVEIWVQLV